MERSDGGGSVKKTKVGNEDIPVSGWWRTGPLVGTPPARSATPVV